MFPLLRPPVHSVSPQTVRSSAIRPVQKRRGRDWCKQSTTDSARFARAVSIVALSGVVSRRRATGTDQASTRQPRCEAVRTRTSDRLVARSGTMRSRGEAAFGRVSAGGFPRARLLGHPAAAASGLADRGARRPAASGWRWTGAPRQEVGRLRWANTGERLTLGWRTVDQVLTELERRSGLPWEHAL